MNSFNDIYYKIKQFYKSKPLLGKIILINVGVFVLISLVNVVQWFLGDYHPESGDIGILTYYLSVPSDMETLLFRPWTFFTYMWTHEGFLHIIFNMLWLYIGGKIFLEYINEKKLLDIYILGGIAGAVFFIIFYNVFDVFDEVSNVSFTHGASASVMAVFVAIAVYAPKYPLRFFLLPPIELRYVALFLIIMDIILIPTGNSGGHIAHLGGMFWGWFHIYQYKKGNDMGKYIRWINFKAFKSFFMKKKKHPFKNVQYNDRPVSDDDYNKSKNKNQKIIDKILEKISKSGYESLTKSEKEILFKASNKG